MPAFLLDTHTFVWLFAQPERIAPTARSRLADPNNIRLVSAASAMEITTKHRIGKWPDATALINDWDAALQRARITETPLTPNQGFKAGIMNWPHEDPFDRMLAAQSIDLNIPLVSKDPVFLTLSGLEVIW